MRARPPEDISPREFFTRWLVDTVAADPERRARLAATRATLVFALEGEGGGEFSVEIAGGRVRGWAGAAEAPQLRVALDVATWRELNAGELSAPVAALERRVRLEGDLMLALKLHLILG